MYIVNLNVLTLFVTIHFERIIVHSWKPHNHNYNVPRTNKKFSAVIFQTTHSSNLLTKHNQLHFLRWGKIISRTNEYVLFNLSSILITSYKKKRTVFWIFYGRRHDRCLECLMIRSRKIFISYWIEKLKFPIRSNHIFEFQSVWTSFITSKIKVI